MTIVHITAFTASGESEMLGFKETIGTRREAAMTVCAFLNQRGGHVPFKLVTEQVRVGELGIGRLN